MCSRKKITLWKELRIMILSQVSAHKSVVMRCWWHRDLKTNSLIAKGDSNLSSYKHTGTTSRNNNPMSPSLFNEKLLDQSVSTNKIYSSLYYYSVLYRAIREGNSRIIQQSFRENIVFPSQNNTVNNTLLHNYYFFTEWKCVITEDS